MLNERLLSVLLKKMEEKSGKLKYQPFFEYLHEIALQGMNIGVDGINDGAEENVIKYVYDKMGDAEDIVLFDVGANIGDYTKLLMKYFHKAHIYCFEPSNSTFEALTSNITSSQVSLNNIGLSDEKTESVLYFDHEMSGMASLYKRQLDWADISFSEHEKITLDTIDSYCEENGIGKIDFLKIDVEGNELNTLKGAKRMIEEGKISAIQIEFGGTDIDSKVFLRDFWYFLSKEYEFYRIVKDGFYPIKSYAEKYEIFKYSNFLLLKK